MRFSHFALILLVCSSCCVLRADSFLYDSTGRLLSASQSNGLVSSFGYDAGGNPLEAQFSSADSGTGGGPGNGIADWWELQYFGMVGIDPLDAPSHDGLQNLVKYGLGLDPTTSGNGGRLSYETVSDGGNAYLSLTYIRPEPVPSSLIYSVEACDDLANWSSAGLVETVSTADGGFRTISVRDAIPLDGSAKRFLRLRVTNPN